VPLAHDRGVLAAFADALLEAPEGRDVGEGVVFILGLDEVDEADADREREPRISKPSAA
jgi:hypothetical protein